MPTNPESIISSILALHENECVTVQGIDHTKNKSRPYSLRVETIATTPHEYCVYTTGEDGGQYILRLSRPTQHDDWERPTISALNTPFTFKIDQLH